MRDPVGDGPGLAGARAGQHPHRTPERLRDHPRGPRGVVHRNDLHAQGREELLRLRERLGVGVHALDVLEPGSGEAEERMVDRHDDLADHGDEGGVQEKVVGLVDRSGLGVLKGHDAEGRLLARHTGEDQPHRLARHRLGVREHLEERALAVRSGLSLIGDLHAAEG